MVIILSLYLTGIVILGMKVIKTMKDDGGELKKEALSDIAGFILGVCLWPIWFVMGMIQGIKEIIEEAK